MSENSDYVLEHRFDSTRDKLWRVWTDPELLARWYGPNVESIVHKFDLRPGGQWLHEMRMGSNSFYQKMLFKEVESPARMVWDHCSVDADWNSAVNPMMPDWPRVLLTTVTFEQNNATTTVTLRQTPVGASDAELACFNGMMAGMSAGWSKGYAIIDEILPELAD